MAHFTARRALTTLLIRTVSVSSASVSSSSASSSLSPSRSLFTLAVIQHHLRNLLRPNSAILTRGKTSGSGYSPLNDPSPNWSNRPPKETILLDGCDYEHWLIVMEFPEDPKPSPEEMVNTYVKTLAQVLGSEEEAKKKIYSVSTTTYTGFGALISEELSYKVKGLPGVLWVLPDSYLDVPNKDYGGDLFVEGKVIRRPQYDFIDRQPSRSRPRPRHYRRRDGVQNLGRGPMQPPTQSWSQVQTQTMQPPMPVNDQRGTQSQGGNPSLN